MKKLKVLLVCPNELPKEIEKRENYEDAFLNSEISDIKHLINKEILLLILLVLLFYIVMVNTIKYC